MKFKRAIFSNGQNSFFGRFVFLMCCSVLLMLGERYLGATNKLHEFIALPVYYLQQLVNLPQKWLFNFTQFFITQNKLLAENKTLQDQVFILQVDLQKLQAIANENQQLKGILNVAHNIKNKYLLAQLLATHSEFDTYQLTLNKGKNDGIYIGQPVLDEYGILGQIIQVNLFSSKVLLLNSSNSGIAVASLRNGVRSVAVGDGASGYLRLTNVAQTTDVKIGDFFLTSGLSDRYPAGYPVGKVIKVAHEPGLSFSTIILAPSAHFNTSKQVLLLWPNFEPQP